LREKDNPAGFGSTAAFRSRVLTLIAGFPLPSPALRNAIQRSKTGFTAADVERIRALASNLNSGFLSQQESQLAAQCEFIISRRR
jgi:hypothetical protein